MVPQAGCGNVVFHRHHSIRLQGNQANTSLHIKLRGALRLRLEARILSGSGCASDSCDTLEESQEGA